MNTKMIWLYAAILAVLAIILPLFNIPLAVGNPNLGSTPATLAAVWLPWPFGVVIALIKGIASSIYSGRPWVEMPSGIGDMFMAVFTYWLARRMHKGWAAGVGQISRLVLTSGTIALCVSGAVALGLLTTTTSPIPGLGSSFFANLGISWVAITFWALVLSAAVNGIVSVVIVLLLSGLVERSLKKA